MGDFTTILCVIMAVALGAFIWKTYDEVQRKKKQAALIEKLVRKIVNAIMSLFKKK